MTAGLESMADDELDSFGGTSGLNRPTLVLNRNWQPVRIASAARCLIMLWNGSAKAVDPHDFSLYTWEDWSQLRPSDDAPFIRTVHYNLCVPEVIVLQKYDRVPTQVVTFSRRNLFRRDHYQCQYCAKKPKTAELTIDHVMPRSRGGLSTWENCVLACIRCNTRKGNRTPDEANMQLRKPPVRPNWTRLFATPVPHISSWSRFLSEAYWNVELQQ